MRSLPDSLLPLSLALVGGLGLHAQGPTVLADANTITAQRSSDPSAAVEVPNTDRCVFAATTCPDGRELWVADGQGVRLLKDINPGPDSSMPAEFVVCGNLVYFRATDGAHGFELWVTDGTAGGTQLVTDLEPGAAGSEPRQLTCCGSRVFFQAFRAATGFEPHVSDGSVAGTQQLGDLNPGLANSLVNSPLPACGPGGEFYFAADDGVHGREIWKSDGTTAGTVRLSDIRPGVGDGVEAIGSLVECGGEVFFVGDTSATGDELFKTDGTPAGTVMVRDIEPGRFGSSIRELTCCGGELFFRARPQSSGAELFKSDGTAAGTVLVKDIRPGTAESFPANLTCCNGVLFFQARDANLGAELFKSDGTEAGTVLVKDLIPGSGNGTPQRMRCCGGFLYFMANSVTGGAEPHISDGTTAGTRQLADVAPGTTSSLPENFSCCGADVLFAAYGARGTELYKIDGGNNNQVQLARDIRPGEGTASSAPQNITTFGASSVAFTVNIDGIGRELVTFINGVLQVHDIRAGSSSSTPIELTTIGETVVFTAFVDGVGRELFAVSETNPTPWQVTDLRPGAASSAPRGIVNVNDETLVFRANDGVHGNELVKVDEDQLDQQNPVVQVEDLEPGSGSSNPSHITPLINATGASFVFEVFTAATGFEIGFGNKQGQDVIDINPGPGSSNAQIAPLNSKENIRDAVPFKVNINGVRGIREFKASNAPRREFVTREMFEPVPPELNFPEEIVNSVKNQSKTIADSGDSSPSGSGREPHVGQEGTDTFQLLADLNPGPASSNPHDFVDIGDFILFVATVGGKGTELVSYDPITDGLTVFDLLPGPSGSDPRGLLIVGDRVWFRASGANFLDVDIYSTDGLAVVKEVDLCPGDQSPDSRMSVSAAGLFFAGFDEVAGVEVMQLANPGARVQLVGKPCDGIARTTATTPRIGQLLTLSAFGGPANHIGVLALDVNRSTPTQFTGCPLWIDLPTAVQLAVTSQTSVDVTLTIPNDSALVGGQFAAQSVWWPLGTIVPVVSSNAAVLTVGN